MAGKRIIYVSDQKYYLSTDGRWFTTSSFAEELFDAFNDLKEWVFFGRLYHIDEDANELFEMRFNSNSVKISFAGVWGSPLGVGGYLRNLIKYVKLLSIYTRSCDIIYLKFSFITSYLCGVLSSFDRNVLITHLVGDIDAITYIDRSVWVRILTKCQRILYRSIARKARLQLYVSRDLESRYAVENVKSEIVCENRFRAGSIIPTEGLRERLLGEGLKLLYVGRISREKGLQDLVAAVKNCPNCTLSIVGTGDFEDQLRELVISKKLEDRISFLGYHSWGISLFSRYESHHCLVLPSYSEGLPLVIIEAMSMGTCVIATNIGGVPEIIENGVNGILYTAGCISELEQAIKTLSVNEELRIRLITEAIKTAHEYSLESQVKKLKCALKSLGRTII